MSGDLLDTFNNIRVASGQDPLHPLLAAGMMAAANVKSESIQKKAAEDAAAQPSPRYTIDPATNTFSVKDAPITDLAEKGAREAVDPIADVHRTLARMGFQTHDPNGPDIAKIAQGGFSDTYHASREYGNGPIGAALDALGTKLHLEDPSDNAQQIHNQRVAQDMGIYKEVKPLLDEARQQRDHAQSQARLQDETYRRDLNQILDQGVSNRGANEDAVVQSVAQEMKARGHALQDEGQIRGQYRTEESKKNTSFYNAVNSRVNGLKPEDLAGYTKATLDQFVSNVDQEFQNQFGRGLPNGRALALKSRASGMLDDLANRKAEQDRKDANQERSNQYLALAVDRAAKGAGPQKLRPFDTINQSVDGLLSAVDDPSFDQASVKKALGDREGKITQRLSELDAKMRGNARAHAENMKLLAGPDGKIDPERAKYDPFVMTRINDAEQKGTTWATEADALKTDLGKLRAARSGVPAAPTQPSVTKFDPKIEAGISAYMQAKKYGAGDRAKAIQELQAAGRLPK